MVYINGKFLRQEMTGVQRFALEISKSLIRNFDNYKIIVPEGTKVNPMDYPQDKIVYHGKGNLNLWEQFHLLGFLKGMNNPLLLTFTGLGPLFYKNKITTVHDLSFLEHPEWFSRKYALAYKLLTPISLRNSLKTITVSEYSKSIIIKNLKKQEAEIEVIPNAVNTCTCEQNINKQKIILAVGSLDPRKNLERLISAFSRWDNDEYQLVIVGGQQKSFSKMNFATNNRVKFMGYVSEQDLHNYYSKSEIFIYPSLYEGFGIPPLEAMAHGTPVIVSRCTSLPDVCRDAAFYIDPYSEESILEGLESLVNSQSLRDDLIKKGYKNIKRFSWRLSAQKLNEIVSKI
ncbi:glycosyltransferase family 4 protein [Ancylomarina sp. YFZ004]